MIHIASLLCKSSSSFVKKQPRVPKEWECWWRENHPRMTQVRASCTSHCFLLCSATCVTRPSWMPPFSGATSAQARRREWKAVSGRAWASLAGWEVRALSSHSVCPMHSREHWHSREETLTVVTWYKGQKKTGALPVWLPASSAGRDVYKAQNLIIQSRSRWSHHPRGGIPQVLRNTSDPMFRGKGWGVRQVGSSLHFVPFCYVTVVRVVSSSLNVLDCEWGS